MKLFGIFLFALGALLFTARVSAGERKKGKRIEGVYLLFLHMRHAICKEGLPLSEVYARFANQALEEEGFLPALRAEGLSAALKKHPPPISDAALGALFLYAEGLGKRFLEEEANALESACERLVGELDGFRLALPSRLKIYRTLLLSGSGMLLLLFV